MASREAIMSGSCMFPPRKRSRETGARHDAADHPSEHDRLPYLGDFGFDGLEHLTLDLSRCICAGYASEHIGPWEDACRLADERLGPVDGPAFLARALMLVRAVLNERKRGFCFMPLGCKRISEDEQVLMAVVHAARSAGGVENLEIDGLATSAPPARTMLAARALAALCLRYQATSSGHFAAPRTLN